MQYSYVEIDICWCTYILFFLLSLVAESRPFCYKIHPAGSFLSHVSATEPTAQRCHGWVTWDETRGPGRHTVDPLVEIPKVAGFSSHNWSIMFEVPSCDSTKIPGRRHLPLSPSNRGVFWHRDHSRKLLISLSNMVSHIINSQSWKALLYIYLSNSI